MGFILRLGHADMVEAIKRFTDIPKYEVECRALMDKVVNDDPSKPYKKRYQVYVRTLHWQELRRNKLKEVGKVCRVCKSSKDLEVHHINYKNLYDCVLSNLDVLCHTCHNSHHKD